VKLVAAATLWCLFSGFLLLPHLGVSALLRTATATLMWLELLATLTWGFAGESCDRRPCGLVAETARAAAGLDIPALSLMVLGLVIAHGLRGRRASAPRTGKRAAGSAPRIALAGPRQRIETHGRAADADTITELGREPVVRENAKRLPHARDVAE